MKCLAVVWMVLVLAGGLMAQQSPVIERLDSANAWINWDRQVIKAVGVGVLPGDTPDQHEAERLARQAAGINAYRNMEAAVNLIRVHGETTVGALTPKVSDLRLKQLAHSAEIVSDRQIYDRSFEVILQIPLSKVAAMLPQSDKSDRSDHELLLDARGLELLPALQPRIFDKAGNMVYSGIARYSTSVTAGDVTKALEVKELTDIVVEGQVQAESVTILVSPAPEPDKTPSTAGPN